MKYTVNTPEVIYRGPSLCTLLAIVFITLKLLGVSAVATWSWWWVLAPLWNTVEVGLDVHLVLVLILLTILVLSQLTL
jgi:hypothetical protein